MSEPPAWRMAESDDDRATVETLEGRWIDELEGTLAPWDEAWPCGGDDGFATFVETQPWMLQRVWVRPELRRQGLLIAQWPCFQECYGDTFKVWQPSAAIQVFLAKVGHPTGPNTGPRADPTNKEAG